MTEHIVASYPHYWKKITRSGCCNSSVPPLSECFWAFVGSIIGIGIVTYLTFLRGVPVLVASPAGATALIAVITQQDWLFPIMPVGVGICILVVVGILVNNIAANRQYPSYWL